jgi:hypothetical protein
MRVPIRRKNPTPVPSERQGICEYPRYQGCTSARFTDRTEPFGKSESGQLRPCRVTAECGRSIVLPTPKLTVDQKLGLCVAVAAYLFASSS